jgi:hypothetical protein
MDYIIALDANNPDVKDLTMTFDDYEKIIDLGTDMYDWFGVPTFSKICLTRYGFIFVGDRRVVIKVLEPLCLSLEILAPH